MTFKDYDSFKAKIENDLDVTVDDDNGFITNEELVGYINEALDDAEALIHTLGMESQYFRTSDTLSLVNGTQDYDVPADIYGYKFLRVFYISGQKKYKVDRVRDLDAIPFFSAGEDFRYILRAGTEGEVAKQRFYPTPNANETDVIHRWYIRNVRAVTTASGAANVIEIPEAHNFIFQHVKVRIYEKAGSPLLNTAIRALGVQKTLLEEALQEMVPDEDNEIEPDFSSYMDQMDDYFF